MKLSVRKWEGEAGLGAGEEGKVELGCGREGRV